MEKWSPNDSETHTNPYTIGIGFPVLCVGDGFVSPNGNSNISIVKVIFSNIATRSAIICYHNWSEVGREEYNVEDI